MVSNFCLFFIYFYSDLSYVLGVGKGIRYWEIDTKKGLSSLTIISLLWVVMVEVCLLVGGNQCFIVYVLRSFRLRKMV